MALKIGASQAQTYYQNLEHPNTKKNDLKGILPSQTQSLKTQLTNAVRQGLENIYDMDCKTTANNIQGIVPEQLTAGSGAGG